MNLLALKIFSVFYGATSDSLVFSYISREPHEAKPVNTSTPGIRRCMKRSHPAIGMLVAAFEILFNTKAICVICVNHISAMTVFGLSRMTELNRFRPVVTGNYRPIADQ